MILTSGCPKKSVPNVNQRNPLICSNRKNKNDLSKRCSWCKSCMNEYAKFYRQKINYPVGVTEKKCFHCDETKPYTEFSLCSKDTSGLNSVCKSCTKDKRRAYMKDVRNFLIQKRADATKIKKSILIFQLKTGLLSTKNKTGFVH
jgi:hypothetical protein